MSTRREDHAMVEGMKLVYDREANQPRIVVALSMPWDAKAASFIGSRLKCYVAVSLADGQEELDLEEVEDLVSA